MGKIFRLNFINCKSLNFKKILLGGFLALFLFFAPIMIFGQVEYISINKQKINTPQDGFHIKQVIDARHDKCNIGQAHCGKDFAKRSIDIEGDFIGELKAMFPAQDVANDTIPVIIKVNEFHIMELWIEGIHYKILRTNLSFYVEKNHSFFHEFTAANFVILTNEKSLKQIDNSIRESFEKSYIEFVFRMRRCLGYSNEVTYAELHKKPSLGELLPDTIINPVYNGIYYTYNNFRDNLIDTSAEISLIDIRTKWIKEGFKKFELRDGNGKVKDSWGVFYEGQFYVRVFNLFAPANISDNNLVVQKMIRVNENITHIRDFYIGDASPIKYVSGNLGLIGDFIEQEIKESNWYVFFPAEFVVDPVSGLALPKNHHEFKSPNNRIIIYLAEHTHFDLKVSINNNIKCSLRSFSYFEYYISPDDLVQNICIETTEEKSCVDVSSSFCNDKYIEVIISKRGLVTINENPGKKTISKAQKQIEKKLLLPVR